MRRLALFAILFLQGCVVTPQPTFKNVIQSRVLVTIEQTNKFKTTPKAGEVIFAESDIDDGTCHIRLAKYPKCLLHEIRHCFEGDYHPNEASDDDC